jgi:hypothetical protein
MTDKTEIVRAIVERALSDLVTIGMTPDDAAALLAVQGVIRVENLQHLKSVIELARDSVQAFTPPESLH